MIRPDDNTKATPSSDHMSGERRTLELDLITTEHAKDRVLRRPVSFELRYGVREPRQSVWWRRGMQILIMLVSVALAGLILSRALTPPSEPADLAPGLSVRQAAPPSAPAQFANGAPATTGTIKRDKDAAAATIPVNRPAAAKAPSAADMGVVIAHGRRMISPDLERALKQHSVVERLHDGRLKVDLPVAQLFQSDMASLDPTSTVSLDYISYVLRNFDGYTARFEVYTMSETGWTSSASLTLARQRGQALAAYLTDHGVPVPRVGWTAKISDPTSAPQAGAPGVENQAVALIIEP